MRIIHSGKGERTGSWVRQVAQAMEEQLKKDQQELQTREHQKKVEDAKRICRIVHENAKREQGIKPRAK